MFGVSHVSAVEFGVAGGNGLLALSRYAHLVTVDSGVRIEVVGFDSGVGLPNSDDIRDMPWNWRAGDFPCEVAALRARLGDNCDLILGPIEETLPQWFSAGRAPVAFASVDIDYYSSARTVCDSFRSVSFERLLPIVHFYFDDILNEFMPRWAGESAALSEMSAANGLRKFDRNEWLAQGRPFGESLWLRRMYSLYCLDHPGLAVASKRVAPRTRDLEHRTG
jgi:hypothetical protein